MKEPRHNVLQRLAVTTVPAVSRRRRRDRTAATHRRAPLRAACPLAGALAAGD
eukprot:gene10513-biopygen8960